MPSGDPGMRMRRSAAGSAGGREAVAAVRDSRAHGKSKATMSRRLLTFIAGPVS